MAIDTTDLKQVYGDLLEVSLNKITSIREITQMEDDTYGKVVSNVATEAMGRSIAALETFAKIKSIEADTAYTNSKKIITEESRIDNLVIEATKAQLQHLATVGAGGLIPSVNDFNAANALRDAVYKRATGSELPTVTFTAGTTYTKAQGQLWLV